MADFPKSMAEAKRLGLKRYFNGKPCPHGHVSERMVSGHCVMCGNIRVSQYQKDNPEKGRKATRRWRSRNRALIKERAREVRGQIEAPTRPKPYTCEICAAPGRKLVEDHDHDTGKFRGWLCNGCNLMLGRFGDNIEGLMVAVRYLEKANDQDA